MEASEPLRADHRFILQIIKLTLNGKVHPIASELSRVSKAFSSRGGSWERLFKGSPQEVDRLKKVLAVAYKAGWLTKTEKWSGE